MNIYSGRTHPQSHDVLWFDTVNKTLRYWDFGWYNLIENSNRVYTSLPSLAVMSEGQKVAIYDSTTNSLTTYGVVRDEDGALKYIKQNGVTIEDVQVTVSNTTGTPSVTWSCDNSKLVLNFSGIKGEKGDDADIEGCNTAINTANQVINNANNAIQEVNKAKTTALEASSTALNSAQSANEATNNVNNAISTLQNYKALTEQAAQQAITAANSVKTDHDQATDDHTKVTTALDDLATKLTEAEQATSAAEKVNAELDGTTLKVTNRKGETTSVDTKGDDGYSPLAKVESIDGGARISVTDKNGTTTADVLNGKDLTITANDDDSVTISNGTISKKFLPQSEIAVWGIVSQTQTWTQDSTTKAYTYVMSNQVWGWIPKSAIDNYNDVGAVFNPSTGYFCYHRLTDISYKEMVAIYGTRNALASTSPVSAFRSTKYLRTICNPYSKIGIGTSFMQTFCGCEIETISFNTTEYSSPIEFSSLFYAFQGSKKLRGIYDYLHENTANYSATFDACYSLEEAKIRNLSKSINFKDSALLNPSCVAYMINNCKTSATGIVITLHSTAYANAMADADVQTALSNHTNVTLASA